MPRAKKPKAPKPKPSKTHKKPNEKAQAPLSLDAKFKGVTYLKFPNEDVGFNDPNGVPIRTIDLFIEALRNYRHPVGFTLGITEVLTFMKDRLFEQREQPEFQISELALGMIRKAAPRMDWGTNHRKMSEFGRLIGVDLDQEAATAFDFLTQQLTPPPTEPEPEEAPASDEPEPSAESEPSAEPELAE